MKNLKPKIFIICQELFQYSLVLYLCLFLIEILQKGFISYFFNINILLLVILLSATLMVITRSNIPEGYELNKITVNEIINIIFIAGISSFLVYFKMLDLGIIAYVVSGMTFVIISLLSYLILSDNDGAPPIE